MNSEISAGTRNWWVRSSHSTSTYEDDPGYFAAVSPADGGTTMVPLAGLMSDHERDLFREFAVSYPRDDAELRTWLAVHYPSLCEEKMTSDQLRSLVADWASASAELDKEGCSCSRWND